MKKILILFCFFIINSNSFSQSKALQALDAYIEKVGGKEAWVDIQSFKLELTSTARGLTKPVDHYMLKPFCFKMVFRYPSGDRILSYDGTKGQIYKEGKVIPMPEDMQIEMREEPDFFDELIFYKEKNIPIEVLRDTTIAGRSYHKFALIKSPVDTQYYYINKDNHLLEMVEETSEEVKWEGTLFKTTFMEYQKVDNILFPKLMDLHANDKIMNKYTIDKVILNPELSMEDFDLKKQMIKN